jgi:hypothetical protein
MANEAVCIEIPTRFRRVTVANGTGIAIGTLMKITDPNTAEATSADNDSFAGIAWEEKTANDGITEITLAVNGVWDITTTNAAITVGAFVSIGGANLVSTMAEVDFPTGAFVGKADETCSGTEVIRVRVGEVV